MITRNDPPNQSEEVDGADLDLIEGDGPHVADLFLKEVMSRFDILNLGGVKKTQDHIGEEQHGDSNRESGCDPFHEGDHMLGGETVLIDELLVEFERQWVSSAAEEGGDAADDRTPRQSEKQRFPEIRPPRIKVEGLGDLKRDRKQ